MFIFYQNAFNIVIFLLTLKDIESDFFEEKNNNNTFALSDAPQVSPKHHTKEIILINGKEGKKLGFSLAGGAEYNSPLVVKNILPGGIAALDGRLQIGIILYNCVLC